jgi:hypothetical protein
MFFPVFGVATSFFGGLVLFVLQIVIWIVVSILRIAFLIAWFAFLLIGKGTILFVLLLLVSLWTYWRNIGILHARLPAVRGLSGFFKELRLYGHASPAALRLRHIPFSVAGAIQNTLFYRRFIAFVDVPSADPITIWNFMSLGWIAQVLDGALTRVVKLAMPIAILASDIVFIPIHMLVSLFT